VLNAEGDGLPGWTVDRYGDLLVSQITSSGLEALRGEAYAALAQHFPDHAVLQVNPPARRREGLATGEDELVRGEIPGEVRFREWGLELSAELGGQKTGFYLDQRPSRRRVEGLAAERTVLDLFAHSGAFSAYALRGGAEAVTAVESAARLEERARNHLRWNNLPEERLRWVDADVFEFLREEKSRHGLVVCDPPPLVRNRHRLDAGARAYKDLNRLAMTHVESGGFLLSFSCSGAVDGKLFRQILFSAATEAEVRVRLLAPLAAGPDHPVSLAHPEGEYLRGWLMQVHRDLRG
jgi:23S rRNA (cytosine1962-C5)-methyltransferase